MHGDLVGDLDLRNRRAKARRKGSAPVRGAALAWHHPHTSGPAGVDALAFRAAHQLHHCHLYDRDGALTSGAGHQVAWPLTTGTP
ncbi:MAG: hypothetical protein ACRDRI_00295 [Pseudonocardiaceae bacterium]